MEHLDDDILRHILRRITTPEARHAMARTARRYLAAIRLEETLHLEISCASWALERVGFEQLRGCDGKLIAAVSIDVDERTLPRFRL